MNKRIRIIHHCWYLLVMALILRIAYLLLSLAQIGLDGMVNTAPDTRVYLEIAEHIMSGNFQKSVYISQVGPGYGLILAGIQGIFGSNPILAIALNILMGSLAPVIIYLTAYQLTRSMIIAIIAGAISAISLTSIALSCNILSDQPYYTFHAAAILCFINGIRTGKSTWFVISGLLLGFAAYVRGIGQFWPFLFLFIPLVIPMQNVFTSRWKTFRKAGLTAIISMIIILAWAGRNYIIHDVFIFGTNGISAAYNYLGAKAIADHTEETAIQDVQAQITEESNEYFKDHIPTVAESYSYTKGKFLDLVRAHPGWVISTYLEIVWGNLRAGNDYPSRQVPMFQPLWRILISANQRWLGGLIFFVALLGLLYLLIDRNYLAFVLLGITYGYFTLISGFSFWQGSRIHFPAEMAWIILNTYAGYRLWPRLARIVKRFKYLRPGGA